MPHTFPTGGTPNQLVGRTPWSARDALVPPVREESVGCNHREADQGVGCNHREADQGVGYGRGRPPHSLCDCPETGKVCGIGLEGRPAGKIACPTKRFRPFDGGKQRGVTLIEMLVVVMIISVIVAISTPSVAAGIDAVRLATATSSVAAFLNSASTHADRRERPVELVIAAKTLVYISTDPGSKHELNMPDGITIEPISAQQSEDAEGISRWLFMPGGAIPSVAIKLSNQHGGARIVKLDPMTGFPRTERVEAK